MKKTIFLSILPVLFIVIFSSCNDAGYKIIENSVYIADAASTEKSKTVSMEDEGVDLNITVRLAKKLDYDVEVELKTNASLLDSYNKINQTEYEFLPNIPIQANEKVIIPAGEIAVTYKLHIDDFDTKGSNYAVPIVLGNVVKGDIQKSNSQSSYIFLITKPLVVSAPVMNGAAGKINAKPTDEKWGIKTKQWSLEFWAKMSNYRVNNQAIFDGGSDDEETWIYIRFGDANRPYNYLQIKTLGGQVETKKDLVRDTWYHWAFVYDGTTLTLYRNGMPDVKFDPPAPPNGVVAIDYMMMISSGAQYFRDECTMSQVRFWKTAISQSQIQNNMFYSISPKNPNLIAYWPMSNADGDIFEDITGNGHDAVVDPGVIKGWSHNVRFGKASSSEKDEVEAKVEKKDDKKVETKDDKKDEAKDTNNEVPIKFSEDPVILEDSSPRMVYITGGTSPYTVSGFDQDIADVKTFASMLVIAAKGEGKTSVKVTDANGLEKKLQIEVKEF